MPKRICLECGRAYTGTASRCPDHRKSRPYYGSRWRSIRASVLSRDRHVCHYCGARANTVDHVIPKERGGTDAPENLVAACGRCNAGKKDRTVAEWRPNWTDEHELRARMRRGQL